MNETVKLSHICPQQINDQIESTDSDAYDIFLVVEGGSYNKTRLSIVQLDPERGEVTSVGEIPFLPGPSVVVCGGSIFCLGDCYFSGLVHQFDLLTRTARTPTRLVESVCLPASVASGHEVIVSGGWNTSFQTVATCSVYTLATNRWTSLRQIRQGRKDHRMCWLSDGRVFAIGGYSHHGDILSSVEMLERAWIPVPREEASAEWQNVAPMKTGHQDFGCCVVEGRIVVAGGWTDGGNRSSSVECFEPPTTTNIGQWTLVTHLASRVCQCFLVPLTAGLLLIDWDVGEMQLGRRKEQLASSDWTWELRPRLTSYRRCRGLVSLPATADASQRRKPASIASTFVT